MTLFDRIIKIVIFLAIFNKDGIIITKICKDCGTTNTQEAKFCIDCGSRLGKPAKDHKKIKNKKEPQKKQLNSYLILSASFVFSLIVIFLIYQSNQDNLHAKIQKARQSGSVSQANENPPSMELMQQIQSLKQSLADDPNNSDLNIKMGNSYFDIGRFEKAVLYYQKVIQINNKNVDVLIDLGVSYFNINKVDSALIYIKQALNIDPANLQGLYNIGVVYYKSGKVDNAIKSWEQLETLHPNSREAMTVKKYIKNINDQQN